ncbi:MAG: DUF4136 domain-containing protein [Bacteroidales bacterium]|nr:DUF4136 domain-containing protein [Bacteroidales bacterium]MCF6342396.1 DUF4136 domain-containing protein [Bacteroidales bacterium]
MKNLFLFLVVFLLFSSCSSLEVVYDYDKSVDFNRFKTFGFYPWDYKNGYQINDYDKQTIMNAIRTEMEDKAYQYVKDEADMLVSVFVTLEGKTSYEAYTNHYGGWAGYGGGWGYSGFGYGYGYGPGYSSTTVTQRNYREGTLIIDVFSVEDKKLIWQGIGSDEVEQDLDKRDRNLPKKVAKVMDRFPGSK